MMSGRGHPVEDRSSLEQWRLFGSSVKGASHKRKRKPNQDAIGWWSSSNGRSRSRQVVETQLPVIMAVADGHGGEVYARSARGAQLAVGCAIKLLSEVLTNLRANPVSYSLLKWEVKERLARDLVQRWLAAVDQDIKRKPVPEPTEDARRLYGTTLLVATVVDEFMLFVQIGDGDIRIVTQEGEINDPFRNEGRMLGNETYSLCTKEVWKQALVHFQMIGQRPPALILLATDGYSNSFSTIADFDRVGLDLLNVIRTEGVAKTAARLAKWLQATSEEGSGDDITLGVICRLASSAPASGLLDSMAGQSPQDQVPSDDATGDARADEFRGSCAG
jgi:serine/threonine protein phosphatase PrpC